MEVFSRTSLSFGRPVLKRDGASVVGEAQLRPYLALMAGEVEGDRMAVKIAHAPNNQCARFHFHKNFSFRIAQNYQPSMMFKSILSPLSLFAFSCCFGSAMFQPSFIFSLTELATYWWRILHHDDKVGDKVVKCGSF